MVARQLKAICSVNAAGALQWGRGVSASARAGAGNFNVTLDNELADAEMLPVVTVVGAAGSGAGGIRVVSTTNFIKQILLVDTANANLDAPFKAAFFQIAWGGH